MGAVDHLPEGNSLLKALLPSHEEEEAGLGLQRQMQRQRKRRRRTRGNWMTVVKKQGSDAPGPRLTGASEAQWRKTERQHKGPQ